MTMAEFTLLAEYWAEHPPVHVMVAGYLGIKAKAKPGRKGHAKPKSEDVIEQFRKLAQQFPGLRIQ